MNNPEPSDGLELSIQAASVAFCGRMADNPAYIRGSRTIYGLALEAHANVVARLGKQETPSSRMISTTFMLGFYEGIISTESGGYLRHVEGAARMVELLGPDGCRDDSVNGLFFTARTQMVSTVYVKEETLAHIYSYSFLY